MARIQRVIDDGVSFYEHQIDKDDGVTLFRGHARFLSEHAIESGGERVEFERALIAAGARPRIPEIPGLDAVPYMTSDDLLHVTELPEHLVCLGAGAVSLEFAQVYRRLGSRVTIVQRGSRLATLEDPELSELLRRYLEEEGVEVITGAAVERAELEAGRPCVVLAGGRRIVGDGLLLGVGRVPVVDGLGLEEIGVETRPIGVVVDSLLRSTLPHVYAIGDAIGGFMFTHVATYEAPIAVANMLDGAGLVPDYRVIPRAIFTAPELAGAGLSPRSRRTPPATRSRCAATTSARPARRGRSATAAAGSSSSSTRRAARSSAPTSSPATAPTCSPARWSRCTRPAARSRRSWPRSTRTRRSPRRSRSPRETAESASRRDRSRRGCRLRWRR